MKISKIWIGFSILAGILMAWVSFLGIFDGATYAKETLNWRAQAMGQDYVNLFVAFPVLLISAYFVNKEFLQAYFFWLGALIYIIYSYILYSFFVHFGPNFLFYVAILGLSFYAAAGSLTDLDWESVGARFSGAHDKYLKIFLLAVGFMFYFLWLSDIGRAIFSGTLPQGVSAIGLFVNPIQVLDMAFVLPGAILTAVFLGKKKPAGYIFAVPLMVFFALMGIAIIAMFAETAQKGFASAPVQSILMAIIVILDLIVTRDFIKGVR